MGIRRTNRLSGFKLIRNRVYSGIPCSFLFCGKMKGEKAMKFQWSWFFALLFAILIAIFSVANVEAVPVNYVFGEAQWPLVLVILGAALLGALISGFLAVFKSIVTKKRVNELLKDINMKEILIADQQNEIADLTKRLSDENQEGTGQKQLL